MYISNYSLLRTYSEDRRLLAKTFTGLNNLGNGGELTAWIDNIERGSMWNSAIDVTGEHWFTAQLNSQLRKVVTGNRIDFPRLSDVQSNSISFLLPMKKNL